MVLGIDVSERRVGEGQGRTGVNWAWQSMGFRLGFRAEV